MAIGVKDKDEDLKAYFAEAESWDRDRFVAVVRSRRVAWIVAIVAIVFAAICAAAVLALSPLKTVVPYVVTVDRSTGATEVTQELRGDKTITRSEEHTSELQSLMRISYAVFCLKKKKRLTTIINTARYHTLPL